MIWENNIISNISNLFSTTWKRISKIDLDGNNITTLDIMSFLVHCPKLRQLHVDKNQIQQLDQFWTLDNITTVSSVVSVYARQNPWHCNEQMDWLIGNSTRQAKGRFVAFTFKAVQLQRVDQMVCHSPLNRTGTDLWQLSACKLFKAALRS